MIIKITSLIFFIKLAFVFFAEYIFSNFYTLADTPRYLSSSLSIHDVNFISSTSLATFLGSIFGQLTSPFYHLPTLFLTYISILYLYRSVISSSIFDPKFLIYFLLILHLFPTFSMWTSIYSKESLYLFFSFMFLSFSINYFTCSKLRAKIYNLFMLIFFGFFTFVFKPQYFPSFIFFLFFLFFNFNKYYRPFFTPILLIILFSSLISFYFSFHYIDNLSFLLDSHFNTDTADRTRDNIFLSSGDVLFNYFYGGYISLSVISLYDNFYSPLFILFIEGHILILLVFYLFHIYNFKFNLLTFFLIFILYYLIFVYYPLAYFNPGSGMRYRTSLLVAFIPLLLIKSSFRSRVFNNGNWLSIR